MEIQKITTLVTVVLTEDGVKTAIYLPITKVFHEYMTSSWKAFVIGR